MGSQDDENNGSGGTPGLFEEQESISMVKVSEVERITFSNLEAMVPPARRRVAQPPESTSRDTAEPVKAKRASGTSWVGYAALVILVLGILGFLVFDMMVTTETSKSVPLGAQNNTVPAAPESAKPPVADQMIGELTIADLIIVPNKGRPSARGVQIQGKVKNETNRIQKGIEIEVSVLRDKVAIHRGRQRCCSTEASAAPETVSLNPGETRGFSIPIEDCRATKGLTVKGRILFSESEKPRP